MSKRKVINLANEKLRRQKLEGVELGDVELRWSKKGKPELTAEHRKYVSIRSIKNPSYWKLANFRSDVEGIVLPYPDIDGKFLDDFGRIRLIPPRVGPDGKQQKFTQPAKTSARLYFAIMHKQSWRDVCADVSVELFIVEGEIKACAMAQHGIPAVGIGGAWNWLAKQPDGSDSLIADFQRIELQERRSTLVFDADIAKKPELQLSAIRCSRQLERAGAAVHIILIPDLGDGVTGVDDFIAKNGIDAFRKLKRRTLDEQEFEDWGLPDRETAFTDAGNAARFVSINGGRVRYVPEWKQYLLWRDRWAIDGSEQVMQLAMNVPRSMLRQAARADDSAERGEIREAAADLENARRLEAMLRLARTDPQIIVEASALDADHFKLGVKNGVVDLRTGKLIRPRQDLLITKYAPVDFDPGAECPRFEKFMLEVMGGNRELVEYAQRMVGYMLTGDTGEQAFFIWYGKGGNGKGTLLKILQAVMGDYAGSARMETFVMQKRNSAGASEDIARLHGKRLVSASELEDGQRLAESLVKEMTGQDKVAARLLHQNSFEYEPTYKIALICNHKPTVSGDDPAIWRRLRLLPFMVKFTINKELRPSLLEELPGVLAWMVRGCLEWQRDGLSEPKPVLEATAEYRDDSDLIGDFVNEECLISQDVVTSTNEIYTKYRWWAEERGHRVMTMTRFSRKLQDRGFVKGSEPVTRRSVIRGVGLRPLDSKYSGAGPTPPRPPAKKTRKKSRVKG